LNILRTKKAQAYVAPGLKGREKDAYRHKKKPIKALK